jgi:hypothetical protein
MVLASSRRGPQKKQISYKIENLIGLIRRVRPLNCPFEFILDGARFSNRSQPLTSLKHEDSPYKREIERLPAAMQPRQSIPIKIA